MLLLEQEAIGLQTVILVPAPLLLHHVRKSLGGGRVDNILAEKTSFLAIRDNMNVCTNMRTYQHFALGPVPVFWSQSRSLVQAFEWMGVNFWNKAFCGWSTSRSHGNCHLESKGMASFNSSSENSVASYRASLIANEAAVTYKLAHWGICCLANFPLKNTWELMQNSHFSLFSKERIRECRE